MKKARNTLPGYTQVFLTKQVTASLRDTPNAFVIKLQCYIFIMTYYTPNFNPTPHTTDNQLTL